MRKLLIIYIVVFFLGGCFFVSNLFVQAKPEIPVKLDLQKAVFETIPEEKTIPLSHFVGETEQRLLDAGLVDLKQMDSSIVIDLKYSGDDNFMEKDVYGDLNKAFLQKDVAAKLQSAQKLLQSRYPYYTLIIFDAVRPRSIQTKMWDSIDVPKPERSKYVSNPHNGSLHNYAAAVDLSIIDEHGVLLDMGTPYDFFGELAYPREEQRMITEGKLTYKQLFNRQILRDVMTESGFAGITTEWWHFNSCSRNEAAVKYEIVE